MVMNEIVRLEYNNKQHLFHFNDTDTASKDWVFLDNLSLNDCKDFCEFMDKKYVNGRVSGILPELAVVKLELELFLQLKQHRRKLAGRVMSKFG